MDSTVKGSKGFINKHGNRRLRPVPGGRAWRLAVFQPEYRPVKKWRAALLD